MKIKSLLLSIIASVSFLFIGSTQLSATIVEIQQMDQILPAVEENTLLLFNISEVVLDSSIDLGTSPWRKYVKNIAAKWNKAVNCNVHDELTLFAARNIPPKAVEEITPQIIANYQNQGLPVLAFTSRGRTEWYSTEVPGVDQLTEDLLHRLNVNFEASKLPAQWQNIKEGAFAPYFHHGIIYANHMDKGEFLKQLLTETGYMPAKIVFVDDKRDSLETVENALKDLGVPFVGFWYPRTAKDHRDFSPMIAHIQLQSLIFENRVLSNAEAAAIMKESYAGVDADKFFIDLLNRIDLENLNRI